MLEIQWWKIPLPGLPGAVGGSHSFLLIVCGEAGSSPSYVLEKAKPRNDKHDGTYVSFYGGPAGRGIGADLLHGATLVKRNAEHVNEDLTMTDLIKVCEHLSSCNSS